jgi:hypothetical protein
MLMKSGWNRNGMGGAATRRVPLVLGLAAAIALSGLSLAAFAGMGNHSRHGFPLASSCRTPSLSGTVVNVALTNMGGPMMDQGNGMMSGRGNGIMSGGAMRLTTDHSTIAHGDVSFLAANFGSRSHEMVILRLSDSQIAGTRLIGDDGKIDEAGSLRCRCRSGNRSRSIKLGNSELGARTL